MSRSNDSDIHYISMKSFSFFSKRRTSIAVIIVAGTMFLTGCAPSALVKPKIVKCVIIPKSEFSKITGTQLPKLLTPLPTVKGDNFANFGGADCVQTAFTYAFAFLYNANKIPDLWAPNMNKDPNFLAKLENDMKALAPYMNDSLKTQLLAAIPDLVNPKKSKSSEKTTETWRELFMIPDRLTNATLPPATPGLDDIESVAPWDLGASVTAPVGVVGTMKSLGKTQVLKLDFKWTSNLVFGTKTRIKSFSPLTRDMTVYLIANPDSWKDRSHPYLIIGYRNNSKAVFGKLVKYDRPLVSRSPN